VAGQATGGVGTERRAVQETLRERTRRAVRSELIDAAVALFAEHGYENITVDQIAQAAGISRRSFFRYFGSKEALVLGKFDRLGDEFAQALSARPADEPAWEALRRMFDPVIAYVGDPELGRRAAEVDRIIHSDESLRAGLVERMQRAQALVVDVLRRRPDQGRREDDLALSALVGAAFAALAAASAHSQATGMPLERALDRAMTSIGAGAGAGH